MKLFATYTYVYPFVLSQKCNYSSCSCSSLPLCLTVYTWLHPQQCSGFTSKKHAFCATIERVGLVHSIDRFDSEGSWTRNVTLYIQVLSPASVLSVLQQVIYHMATRAKRIITFVTWKHLVQCKSADITSLPVSSTLKLKLHTQRERLHQMSLLVR